MGGSVMGGSVTGGSVACEGVEVMCEGGGLV